MIGDPRTMKRRPGTEGQDLKPAPLPIGIERTTNGGLVIDADRYDVTERRLIGRRDWLVTPRDPA